MRGAEDVGIKPHVELHAQALFKTVSTRKTMRGLRLQQKQVVEPHPGGPVEFGPSLQKTTQTILLGPRNVGFKV